MSSRWSKRLSLSVALALSVLPTVGQVVRAQGASYIPASELGMSPDKSARENRNAFVSKLNSTTYRDASVVFPPGKYLMDNSDVNPRNGVKDFIELKGFTGELKMEEGASFSRWRRGHRSPSPPATGAA